ncbi:MAG: HAD family hydrolase [Bacillota bacterium]
MSNKCQRHVEGREQALPLSTVLFDLDGTLADSLPLIERSYRQVFQVMGLDWNQKDVMRMIGLPLKTIAGDFAGKDVEEFIKTYQHVYHRDHDLYMSLYPGTAETLELLQQKGMRLGIVTSKGKPGTMRTLDFAGMSRWLDVVITADDVVRHKPEPDPILKALEILGATQEETVYVGDSVFDLVAGQRAGVKIVGVTWGAATAEELSTHNPDLLANTWEELTRWITDHS